MQMLDATILNTALPEIAADLNESPLNMQLAVISNTLTVALLIPLSGYLADRFGTKKSFRSDCRFYARIGIVRRIGFAV